MPYGSICCTYHQLKYSSPHRSNKQKRQDGHTKDSYPVSELEVWGKRDQENGPKAEKGPDKTERSTGLDTRIRD